MNSQRDATGGERTESPYTVRRFRDGDRAPFLDLFETVFGGDHGREWFAWKYGDNPYVDHVPIYVVERDGAVVGARSFLALEMAVDGVPHRALEPCDTMVHPDHRGRGLLTRMTEAAVEAYTDAPFSFCFNFPNHITLPHNLRHGWETVATIPTYYRLQNPRAVATREADASWASLAGLVATPVAGAYYRTKDRLASPSDEVTVRGHDDVPVGTLAELHETGPQRGILAHRDERFYAWRFGNPDWAYRAYVASAAGAPVAGVVVGTATNGGVTTAKVADVVPTPGPATGDAFGALLHRVARDYRDADVLAAPPCLPQSVLEAAGFRSDARPPLAAVSDRTTHVARTLTDDWAFEGLDIRDGDNWHMAFVERDAS